MSSPHIDQPINAEPGISTSRKAGNNNALTHGGTTQKLILPGENHADFEALLAGLQDEYRPETQQHHLFVEQLALGHWFLLRRQRAYNAIEAAVYDSAADDPELLNEDHFRRLALAERYKVAAERALKRAFANVESIRKERKTERDYRESHARWQAVQQLRERRLQLEEEKTKQLTAKKQSRAERRAVESEPSRPPIQWPTGPLGRPVPKEIRDQALMDAQRLWNNTK